MNENYIEVGVDDYEETVEEAPIIYTRDVKTCIAALLHLESSAILLHIEANKDEIKLDNYRDVLKELSNEIQSIELFTGPDTINEHVQELINISESYNIEVEVLPCKVDDYGSGSIGFNQSNHSYYDILMEQGKPIFNSYDVYKMK